MSFWIPVAVFVTWFFVMFWAMRKAVFAPQAHADTAPVR
jgi:hypothetical protein